jgi:dTDP-4-amino-4,6-dideoxygalactose transaminase
MIVTDDDRLRAEALVYRDQGKAGFSSNFHTRLGYNWRMSELHAVLGRAQLRRLPEFISARREIAAIYDAGLAGHPRLVPLAEAPGAVGNYYKYVIFFRETLDRAALKRTLREGHGVSPTGEVYELPCHRQPVFESIGGSFPDAESACASHVCLPISPRMTAEEATYVVEALRAALEA